MEKISMEEIDMIYTFHEAITAGVRLLHLHYEEPELASQAPDGFLLGLMSYLENLCLCNHTFLTAIDSGAERKQG